MMMQMRTNTYWLGLISHNTSLIRHTLSDDTFVEENKGHQTDYQSLIQHG